MTIPMKIIQKLWDACMMTSDTIHKGAYALKMEVGWLELYHYGTLILIIKNGQPSLGEGYSKTDRDAINSILVLHCLDDNYKARIRNGTLELVNLKP